MKPSHGQQQFDFDRGEQLALLDALVVPSGEIADGKATVRVSGATALSVLRAIESHGRTTGQCWASATTIGREINRNERTVRRAVVYLESIELLIIDRSAGRQHRCRINWGEISLKARSPHPGHSLADPGQFDRNPGQFDANPGHSVRRSVSKRKRSLPPSSPDSIDGPRRNDSAVPRESWSVVEGVLCGLLGDWTRALRDAKRNGVGPRHVQEIIDHYHKLSDRVTPGALYWRLRRAHPSLAPQDGWPVEPSRPKQPTRETSDAIFHRVVRAGRRSRTPDEEIRATLRRELVAAGYSPDTERF